MASMQDALNNNYQGMTHTGRKPQGLQFAQDVMQSIQNAPGNILKWAQNNPVDAAFIAASTAPIVGDAIGFGKDVYDMSPMGDTPFTATNTALAGAGLLPFVPAGMGSIKKVVSDLPMDEASRMARAKEQGFDVDAFHGTTSDFKSVDKDKFGKSQAVFGDAFYSTTNPKRASTYAGDTGQIMPVMLRSEDMIDLTKPASVSTLTKMSDVLTNAGAKVEVRDDGTFFAKLGDKSVFIDSYSPMDVNFKKLKDGFGKENAQKILEEAGVKGLIGPEGLGTKVFANYDPTSIRSRFAQFNPLKKNSTDLLAGIGGATIIAPSMINALQSEDRNP